MQITVILVISDWYFVERSLKYPPINADQPSPSAPYCLSLSLGFKWYILINTINTFITYTSFTRYEINYTQNWIECSGTTVQKTWFVSCCLGGHQSCFNWNWAISKPKIEMIKTRLDGDLLWLLLCVYLLVRKFLKWNRKRLSFDNDFNFYFFSRQSLFKVDRKVLCVGFESRRAVTNH